MTDTLNNYYTILIKKYMVVHGLQNNKSDFFYKDCRNANQPSVINGSTSLAFYRILTLPRCLYPAIVKMQVAITSLQLNNR